MAPCSQGVQVDQPAQLIVPDSGQSAGRFALCVLLVAVEGVRVSLCFGAHYDLRFTPHKNT